MLDAHSEMNLKRFHESLDHKPLVLFLGAGVNGGDNETQYTKCFSWKNLLKSALNFAMNDYQIKSDISKELRDKIQLNLLNNDSEFNTYQKATIIKNILGDNYIPILQDAIYSTFNEELQKDSICSYLSPLEETRRYTYMHLIADLCCRTNKVIAVVTYNYDNFLSWTINTMKENLIKQDCKGAFNVIESGIASHISDIPVYHVHGFIPPPNKVFETCHSNIVLSYDEYFQNMLKAGSWQTTTQLHFLSNFTCLFLGASLTDWNMLRMISNAKDNTYHSDIYTLELYSPDYFLQENDVITTDQRLLNKHIQSIRLDTLNSIGIRPINVLDKSSNFQTLYQVFNEKILEKCKTQ